MHENREEGQSYALCKQQKYFSFIEIKITSGLLKVYSMFS